LVALGSRVRSDAYDTSQVQCCDLVGDAVSFQGLARYLSRTPQQQRRNTMDTLTLTVKLAQTMRDGDHDAINRILFELERRLSPEDVALILEGLCGGKPGGQELPELPPTRLASCA